MDIALVFGGMLVIVLIFWYFAIRKQNQSTISAIESNNKMIDSNNRLAEAVNHLAASLDKKQN
jgi:uncharacterized protein (UPF0333 family)